MVANNINKTKFNKQQMKEQNKTNTPENHPNYIEHDDVLLRFIRYTRYTCHTRNVSSFKFIDQLFLGICRQPSSRQFATFRIDWRRFPNIIIYASSTHTVQFGEKWHEIWIERGAKWEHAHRTHHTPFCGYEIQESQWRKNESTTTDIDASASKQANNPHQSTTAT